MFSTDKRLLHKRFYGFENMKAQVKDKERGAGASYESDEHLKKESEKEQTEEKEEKIAGRMDEDGVQAGKQPGKIKVLLADDHQMVREALCEIVNRNDDMEVIAEAENGAEAVYLTGQVSPHIIVMDINMPKLNGIEATQIIVKDNHRLRIIGLSIHDKKGSGKTIQRAGAHAYLTKDEAAKTLCKTIRSEYAEIS